MAKILPTISNVSDLRNSIKTTLSNIDTVQDRIHNEAIACIVEFFRRESKGNTNWINEHITAYLTVGGSLRVQALAGWYHEYAGVKVIYNPDGSLASVKKDKSFKADRDHEQLEKCKSFPFYKWGLDNLERPLATPVFPENAATMLAKGVLTGTYSQEEALAWIEGLRSKMLVKEKDENVLKFVANYKAQNGVEDEEEDLPPAQEVQAAQAAQA